MNQKGNAEGNLSQIGRDYIRSFFSFIYVNQSKEQRRHSLLSRFVRCVESIRNKDRVISQLEKENKELRNRNDSIEPKINEAFKKLQNILKIIAKEGKENNKISKELIEVLDLFKQLDDYRQNGLKHYQNAALWFRTRLNDLVDEAVESVRSKFPEDISEEHINEFQKSLTDYMEWLHESMVWGRPFEDKLSELNLKRSIRQPQPYREAISYIGSKVCIDILDEKEYQALNKMLNFLRRHL